MSSKRYRLKDLSKPLLDAEGNVVDYVSVIAVSEPPPPLPEGIDIELPDNGRLTPNPFHINNNPTGNMNMNINYEQHINQIAGMDKLLSSAGEDISKTLVKTSSDGNKIVVPPCEYQMYPILLDKEIESARNLIKKPNFGRAIIYTVLGWILVAAVVGDILGLSGSDYFVAYATVLGATVGSYLNAVWDSNKQTAALAEIRTSLLEQYMRNKP